MSEELKEFKSSYHEPEAIDAYVELRGEEYATVEDFEASYSGQFDSAEEFAQDMAENIGEVPNAGSSQWPLYCIDWEYAARELMMDYSESNGYYFRDC